MRESLSTAVELEPEAIVTSHRAWRWPVLMAALIVAGGAIGLALPVKEVSGDLELVGSAELEIEGPPAARRSVEFRLRNRSGRVLQPAIVWKSCACNDYEIVPDSVAPGAVCVLRIPVDIPLIGKGPRLRFGVAPHTGRPEGLVRVSARGVADDSPALLVRPANALIRIQEGGLQKGARHRVLLDVFYSLGTGHAADPSNDIRCEIPSIRVLRLDAPVNRVDPGFRYSGQVTFDLEILVDLEETTRLEGAVSAPGAEAAKLTLQFVAD